jgi:riboflavin kinase / FMN adenylyltransferase
VRPTFNTGRGELIEAYLLDFDGDLYGQQLRLEFLERLRGERRFESPERLIEQMRADVERTRAVTQAL